MATSGGAAPKLLGDGDDPAIAPAGDRVAFVREKRIWIAPIDGSKPAEQAFFARGASEAPAWSPDGKTLGVRVQPRRPQLHRHLHDGAEADPLCRAVDVARRRSAWSTESREIAFVRQPGRGGTPTSPLRSGRSRGRSHGRRPRPRISGEPRRGRPFRVVEERTRARRFGPARREAHLQWAADDHIVFMSYQDGWPHLYSIHHPGEGGKPALLTPGAFMVEHVIAHARRHSSSSTAPTPAPMRTTSIGATVQGAGRRIRRAGRADTAAPGIEWSPVVTGDGQTVVFLGSTAQQSPLPAVHAARRRRAETDRGASACRQDFPSSQLITPRAGDVQGGRRPRNPRSAVQDRERRGAASGARLRARRAAAADAARLALHGLLRERLRREPVPRQPRLHRAVGELPSRHRLRPRVPVSGERRAARRVRVSRRPRRREISAGAHRRRRASASASGAVRTAAT